MKWLSQPNLTAKCAALHHCYILYCCTWISFNSAVQLDFICTALSWYAETSNITQIEWTIILIYTIYKQVLHVCVNTFLTKGNKNLTFLQAANVWFFCNFLTDPTIIFYILLLASFSSLIFYFLQTPCCCKLPSGHSPTQSRSVKHSTDCRLSRKTSPFSQREAVFNDRFDTPEWTIASYYLSKLTTLIICVITVYYRNKKSQNRWNFLLHSWDTAVYFFPEEPLCV